MYLWNMHVLKFVLHWSKYCSFQVQEIMQSNMFNFASRYHTHFCKQSCLITQKHLMFFKGVQLNTFKIELLKT